MRLTSSSIQRLLTASERTLVDAASASNLKDLSAARLRGTVARARTLRDKYTADARSVSTKADVFGLVLDRLEKQLGRLEKQLATREQSAAATRKQAAATARKPATARTAASGTRKATGRTAAASATRKAATRQAATRKAAAATPRAATPRKATPHKATPRKATTRKAAARKAAAPRPTMAERRAAAEQMPRADLKARARELVATVRARVAEHEGTPATAVPDPTSPATGADGQATQSSMLAAETEAMQAHSAEAAGSEVEHRLAASHLTRLQGHARGRGQRAQGRRDSR